MTAGSHTALYVNAKVLCVFCIFMAPVQVFLKRSSVFLRRPSRRSPSW